MKYCTCGNPSGRSVETSPIDTADSCADCGMVMKNKQVLNKGENMRYGLIVTITPLTTKSDKFPEGMSLVNSEKQFISKKNFKNPDQAEDYLYENGYSKGTGFYCKLSNGTFYNVIIAELI